MRAPRSSAAYSRVRLIAICTSMAAIGARIIIAIEPMMPGAVVVVAIAAEEHAELRQHRDRAGDRRGDGHHQRVVVLDVREFMRDHAGEFLAAERLHQPGGHGDGGVLRIAAGGERIGLRIVHQEDARHRQAGASGERRPPG